ncbi:MAG: hypothetical protein Q9165_005267 [Trypethelium subeluteriae]
MPNAPRAAPTPAFQGTFVGPAPDLLEEVGLELELEEVAPVDPSEELPPAVDVDVLVELLVVELLVGMLVTNVVELLEELLEGLAVMEGEDVTPGVTPTAVASALCTSEIKDVSKLSHALLRFDGRSVSHAWVATLTLDVRRATSIPPLLAAVYWVTMD